MHHLNIDLETFSSEPIGETGAFKYIESPDFEVGRRGCATGRNTQAQEYAY